MKQLYRVACGIIIFVLNPGLVGFTTGWLVGVSPTPAVGVVLPLIFGFLGMLGIGATARLLQSTTASDPGDGSKSNEPSRTHKTSEDLWGDQLQLFGYLATSCFCFCLPFYLGIYDGIATRSPFYPPPQESFENLPLRAEEIAALENLRGVLRYRNIPVADYQAVLEDVFVPIVKLYPLADSSVVGPTSDMRYQSFFNAVNEITKGGADQQQRTPEGGPTPPAAPAPEGAPAPAPPTEPMAA